MKGYHNDDRRQRRERQTGTQGPGEPGHERRPSSGGNFAYLRRPVLLRSKVGDYDEPASLVSAYQGLDRLLLIPSASLQRPGVRGGQLAAAIDAAKQAGVSHVVLMSAAGTKEAPDNSVGGAYWTGEQHLIKTTPHWTILRMNYYAESMAEEIQMSLGMNVLTGLGDERVAYVSRDGLAAAAAGVLLGDGHGGAIYNGTGPTIVNGPDKAAFVSGILGKALSYAVIKEEQLRAALSQAGMPEFVVEAMVGIKTTFVRGHFDILTSDIERLSGRAPTSFRDVLAATLKGVRAVNVALWIVQVLLSVLHAGRLESRLAPVERDDSDLAMGSGPACGPGPLHWLGGTRGWCRAGPSRGRPDRADPDATRGRRVGRHHGIGNPVSHHARRSQRHCVARHRRVSLLVRGLGPLPAGADSPTRNPSPQHVVRPTMELGVFSLADVSPGSWRLRRHQDERHHRLRKADRTLWPRRLRRRREPYSHVCRVVARGGARRDCAGDVPHPLDDHGDGPQRARSRARLAELEGRVLSDRVEVVLPVNEARKPSLHNVEERVERGKRGVLRFHV